MANPDDSGDHGGRRQIQSALRLLLLISSPIAIALLLAAGQLEDFYPAAYPAGPDAPASAASVVEHWAELGEAERVGDGIIPGPEDLAYDDEEGFLYTGCHDGWIRRLRPAEAARDVAVEEWANVGGRPLGVALSPDGGVVVAEAYKEMMKLQFRQKVTLQLQTMSVEAATTDTTMSGEARIIVLAIADTEGMTKAVTVMSAIADTVVMALAKAVIVVSVIAVTVGSIMAGTEGLMKVKKDGKVILLTDEAEGRKFKLTDGVDVASDGLIYFTDASLKYSIDAYMMDVLEGRPNGRLMSYDASTNQTAVLARDLYFPNGVSLSPDHRSLLFCETALRRCNRFHIKGENKGTIEKFLENLPGYPDNIRYDGAGYYWIGLSAGRSHLWDFILKYPFIRKLLAAISKLTRLPEAKDGGVLSVNLQGRPLALYKDREVSSVSGGLKVGKHLYIGSLNKRYIHRIDLTKFASNAL